MENEEALAIIDEIRQDRHFNNLSKWAMDFLDSVEEQLKKSPWKQPSDRQAEKLEEIQEQL